MRITLNTKRRDQIVQLTTQELQKERTGIHASDLLAPRLAFYRKLQPLPLTLDEIGYFATGHGHHMFLVTLMANKKHTSQEESKYSKRYNITYSPDLSALQAEFKTSRLQSIPETEAECRKMYEEYTKQSLVYAICEQVDKWNLYINFIGLREKYRVLPPRIECYTIHWSQEEIQEGIEWIDTTVKLLAQSLKTKKLNKKLPLCAEFKCYRWDNATKEKKVVCPYFEQCKPEGRYLEWKNTQQSITPREKERYE